MQIQFDANKVAPDQGLTPVPRGYYTVIIVGSEIKPTKRGDGEFIEFKLQVHDGPYAGKTIVENVNWKNPNATATAIGQGQLSAICHAVGVLTPQDTNQLHNIPLGVEVDVTDDGKYNDVNRFFPASKVAEMPPLPEKVIRPASGPVPATPIGMQPAPAPAPAMQFSQGVTAAPPAPVAPAAPLAPTAPAATAAPVVAPAPVAPAAPAAEAAPPAPPAPAPVEPQAQPAPTAETPPWIAAQQAAAAAQEQSSQ